MPTFFKFLNKYFVLGALGGAAYYVLEVLVRGYSHYSMAILGGVCFILIGMLNEFYPWEMPLISQMFISAIIITSLELITGLIVNVHLGLGIWDYSHLPYNIMGQICLLYSVVWFFLSLVAIVADDWIRYRFFDEERPHYTLLGYRMSKIFSGS